VTIMNFFSRFKRTVYRTLGYATIDTRHGQATVCMLKEKGNQVELIMLID